MTLRTRLFLTSLLIAAPLAVALFLIDDRMRLAAKELELRQSIENDLGNGLGRQCQQNPPRTGRPGRGGQSQRRPPPADRPPPPPPGERPGEGQGAPRREGGGAYEYFAYAADGTPSASDAPPLPADRSGTDASTYWTGSGQGISLVVPLGGDGPCAFLLARIPPRPEELRDRVQALGLVLLSVLAAVWIAAGPVISRLRRLKSGVHQSAASHYAEPVAIDGRDEVGELGAAFNEAGRQVREHLLAVQGREEALRGFVADTTHDVAIPLTVLQGHLADLDRSLSDPDHRKIVSAAVQEAHYMGSLLRNLGAATRLGESGQPVLLSPVDVSALVERVVARHQPIARTAEVDLNAAVPDPPLVVSSDHTLLEQALSNIVDNAVRYNRPRGHVAVVLDRDGAGFSLSVEDDGPGVTDEELSRLTTRSFRGSAARTRRPDGRGLGLAIAMEALTRLGLSLTFQRSASGGLRAEIRPAAGGPVSDPSPD